ncbi:MAG: hypothetical protein Q8P95_02390 [bacterium]|nr:hypothetical protein [bacterium]
MKVYDTIIIGGGISGLGCARTLYDNGYKNFKIISKDIGGRIVFSKDDKIAYGAFFIGSDYTHLSKYTKRGKKIDFFQLGFHKNGKTHHFISCLRYPIQFIRLVFILLKYRKHYLRFKERCKNVSQKKAIEESDYLSYLFKTKASVFIKEHKISDLADDYASEAIYGLIFCRPSKLKALEYLRWALYLLFPIYEFTFLKKRLLKGIDPKVHLDEVTQLEKDMLHYRIRTASGKFYRAKNIVIALPLEKAKKLIDIKVKPHSIEAYMFHIEGEPRKKWKQVRYHLFDERSEVLDLACQKDGSYLFYHKRKNPDFEEYFKKYKIIAKKHWEPAFSIAEDEPVEFFRGKNLYMIGDFNMCGMEDSYITGIYAAKQILKQKG